MPFAHVDADVLCLCELQNIELWDHLCTWLEEKDSRKVLLFSRYPLAQPLHPRVQTISWDHRNDPEFLQCIVGKYPFQHFDYFVQGGEEEQALFSQLARWKEEMELCVSDYADLGERLWRNLFHNFLKRKEARNVQDLAGKFKDIPAIICGSGPSLSRVLPFLHRLHDRSLFFVGGSALSKVGDWAHFGACIDPDHTVRGPFRCPFFYQDRTVKELVAQVAGSLLWVPDSGGIPLERSINAEWGIKAFDGGWNVASFCLALAHLLGCRPIALVGVDFAYEDPLKPPRSDWIVAAHWIEEFAKAHPEIELKRLEIDVCLKNLILQDIPKITVDEWGKDMIRIPSLTQHIMKEISGLPLWKQAMVPVVDQVRISLERCRVHCQTMLRVEELSYPVEGCTKGEYMLAEVELEEERVFQTILRPLWSIWEPLLAPKNGGNSLRSSIASLLFYNRVITCIQKHFPSNIY